MLSLKSVYVDKICNFIALKRMHGFKEIPNTCTCNYISHHYLFMVYTKDGQLTSFAYILFDNNRRCAIFIASNNLNEQ